MVVYHCGWVGRWSLQVDGWAHLWQPPYWTAGPIVGDHHGGWLGRRMATTIIDASAHHGGLPLWMGGPRDGDRHVGRVGPWSLQVDGWAHLLWPPCWTAGPIVATAIVGRHMATTIVDA